MPKMYTRNQGGEDRFYADLRDLGGGQVALRRSGSSRATTDKDEAAQLFADRIRELSGAVSTGFGTPLGEFVEQFLDDNPKGVTERWLKETRFRLRRAVEFFGVDRSLTTIRPKDVRQWLTRFLHLSTSNQRHHLHALSGLYGYAQEMEIESTGRIQEPGSLVDLKELLSTLACRDGGGLAVKP